MTPRKKPGPKPTLTILPPKLKRLRLERGFEVAVVAEIAEISIGRLRQLEAGIDPGISLKTAHGLGKALGCNFGDFTEIVDRERAS